MSSPVDREFKDMMDRKQVVLLGIHSLIQQFNDLMKLCNDSDLRRKYPECCTDINTKMNKLTTTNERLSKEYNDTIKPGALVQTHIHTMKGLKQYVQNNLDEGFKLYELINNRYDLLTKTKPSDIPNTINNLNASLSFAASFDLPAVPTHTPVPRKKGGKRKSNRRKSSRRKSSRRKSSRRKSSKRKSNRRKY